MDTYIQSDLFELLIMLHGHDLIRRQSRELLAGICMQCGSLVSTH